MSFRGRVQGVGFRATARQVARGHAVTGWVRNEPDGSVTLEVQGSGGAVREYREALREMVAGLVQSENELGVAVVEGETEFEVRR